MNDQNVFGSHVCVEMVFKEKKKDDKNWLTLYVLYFGQN
jgi:hypothetical protein